MIWLHAAGNALLTMAIMATIMAGLAWEPTRLITAFLFVFIFLTYMIKKDLE